MMQAIIFTMVVLALFSSVIAVSPVQTFEGDCQDAHGRGYNFCIQAASSGEECKQKLLASSSAVCANYIDPPLHCGNGNLCHGNLCQLGYTADTSFPFFNDGTCLIQSDSGHGNGYAVGGNGLGGGLHNGRHRITCYAKSPIQSFDVTHERIEELLVFQEDSSRAVMYNVLTGAMWVSAAIAMTIGGVFVMRLRSLSMRGGGLVTAEPLLG